MCVSVVSDKVSWNVDTDVEKFECPYIVYVCMCSCTCYYGKKRNFYILGSGNLAFKYPW